MSPESNVEEASQTQRPMGKLLETPAPSFPAPTTLEGRACSLSPLTTQHYPLLHKALCTPPAPPWLWDYMLRGPFPEFSDFEDAMNSLLNNNKDTTQYFVITTGENAAARTPAGMVSFIDIKPAHRSLEIGNVIYSPALQRTAAATEAISLLLRHAFTLNYRRVVWKCNDLNATSKRAALRLGFEYEGVSKCHMVVRGRNRDTAWFSITEDGWPVAQQAFEEWLRNANFDEAGQQKEKLEDVRRRIDQ